MPHSFKDERTALRRVSQNTRAIRTKAKQTVKKRDTRSRSTNAPTSKTKAPRFTKSSKATRTKNEEASKPSKYSKQPETIRLKARFVAIGKERLFSSSKRAVGNMKSPLNNSFMGKKEREDEEIKVLTIPVSGLQTQVSINAYFGDGENESGACELTLDTGSSFIWVNNKVYQKALEKNHVTSQLQEKSYSDKFFEIQYAEGEVNGKLYRDTISFKTKNIFVEQHIFGIVDEDTCPIAKMWREHKYINMKGVFGIGPRALNADIVLDANGDVIQDGLLPSLIDNLRKQKKISAKMFGLYFQLPGERESNGTSSSSASSDSDITMEGELHIGGPNKNAYIKGSMKEIPCTEEGLTQFFYGVDLTLKYNGETLMDNKPGIIDSGKSLIMLPESVLDAYVKKVGKHKDGRPIVTYEDESGLYRIAKKDIGMLKDLEFDFVKGENAIFKLSPEAQIVSPYLSTQEDTDVGLVFEKPSRNHNKEKSADFILGLGWMMHHYVVFDSSNSGKKVYIAKKNLKMQIKRE